MKHHALCAAPQTCMKDRRTCPIRVVDDSTGH